MANYTYFVSSGQVQNVVRLESQTMFVASGGTAGRITVSDRSTLGVDGLAMQITVLDGGTLNVFRGKASPVTVSSGGRVFISSGGETSGTDIKTGGTMYIINGKSIAPNIDGGILNAGYSSGNLNAENAVVSGAVIKNGGLMNVSSSAEVFNTVIDSNGSMHISSGGTAVQNSVNSAGNMIISSSGNAIDTTVLSGGILTIEEYGTHYGSLTIANGAEVIAKDNSNICFDLRGQKPDDTYFINDAALIKGNPDFSISISASQAAGTYKLASNAGAIQYVSISVDGMYRYAEINGDGFFSGQNYFYLKRTADNDLCFIAAAPPSAPQVSADNKKLTNQNVTLTAVFPTDSTGQYSVNGTEWLEYTEPLTVESNGTYFFRAVNSEKMFSQVTSYTVSNIDKDAPELEFSLFEHPKNINVTVKISANDISGIATTQYRIDGDEKSPWLTYNAGKGIKINSNSTLYVKSVDKTGNSVIESRTFELDTLPDNNWTDLKTVGGNSQMIGRTAEYASENPNIFTISGWVGLDDTNDYHEIKLTDAGKYFFDLSATDKTKFTVYQLIKNKNGTFKLKSLQNTSLKYDKTKQNYSAETKGLLLEEGTYYIAMKSASAKGNADYSITVNSNSQYFPDSKNGQNDDWLDMKTAGDNSTTLQNADFENISNWVGFGDAVDYFKVNVHDSGKYNFSLEAGGKTKFTIYQLVKNKNGTFKLKTLQSTSLKYNKETTKYQSTSKDLWLADGTYYISMTSTNAAKGGNAAYNISSNAVEIYTESKNGHNDDWQDMKLNGGNSEFIGEASYNEEGTIEIADWVGLGDAVDYKKLTIEETTKLSLSVSADDKAKFTIYQLVENKNGTYKLKAVKSSTLAKQKYFYIEAVPIAPEYGIPRDPTLPGPIIPIEPIVPSPAPKPEFHMYHSYIENLILEGGTYYIAMTSTNAAKGGNAAYKINETDSETVKTEFVSSDDDTWKKVSQSDALQVGDAIHNWVGYGDAKDFFKFELTENGKVRFSAAEDEETFYDIETLDALHNKDIKLTCLNEKGKSVKLVFDEFNYTSQKELSAGTYYIGIQSSNVKKHWTEYEITIQQIN